MEIVRTLEAFMKVLDLKDLLSYETMKQLERLEVYCSKKIL
jgi:hypothetical protein